MTFAEVLSAVRHGAREALVWQDFAPADALPLPVGFVRLDGLEAQAGELTVALRRVSVSGAGLRLWLTCLAGPSQLTLTLHHDDGFIAAEQAHRLAQRVQCLLEAVAEETGAPVAELPVVGERERRMLLEEFNSPSALAPPALVPALFGGWATATPDAVAVADASGTLTYAELDRRANQLAHRLQRSGVGPETAVGLCIERSSDAVVGLLGILKAGGAYVPLEPDYPAARLAHQLAVSGAHVVVTQEALLDRLDPHPDEVICLDRDRSILDAEAREAPAADLTPENLAYIIYTSGSTGVPKGVAVTHGNLAHYTAEIIQRVGASQQRLSFGLVTSIATDLGNTSLFGALCSGGTLVVFDPVAAADTGAFVGQVQRTPVDVLKITPSHLAALIAGGERRILPRRWLVLGGERAPWDLIDRVRALADCAVLNHYGPTETTVGCCVYPVPVAPAAFGGHGVPIGSPITGAACYVLDERRQLVPLGTPGRLWVSGAGVARGYLGAGELTTQRFLADPFRGQPAARMYDTGDLARWLPEGTLEFLGRADEQVKIRGYRVEPAEIEAALRSHENVTEAVVVVRSGPGASQRLVAYCTLDAAVGQPALVGHLGQWLPEYMIPSAIVALEQLPRTPSGKVDRLALPEPDENGAGAPASAAPQTPVQEAIAAIWSDVLGVSSIGIEDDFFALGGHSLLATQVVAHVRSEFAVDLPLHSLFTHPTVASLSTEVVRMMGDTDEETAALLAEVRGLSDDEAERLLGVSLDPPAAG